MDNASNESEKVKKYNKDIHWLEYQPGGENKYGEKITRILGRSSNSIVYLIRDENEEKLKCHWDPGKCMNGTVSNATAYELLTQIETGIKQADFKKTGRDLIGSALFRAFETQKIEDTTDYFSTAKDYVSTKMFERAHYRYLLAAFFSVLFAIFITVACLYFLPNNSFGKLIIIAGGIGSIGAFVSVLQRYKSIEIQRYSSTSYLALGAITRILLGMIFGMVFILAHQSELILTIIDENMYSIYLFAFISGISERFVPELIERVESLSLNKTNVKDS